MRKHPRNLAVSVTVFLIANGHASAAGNVTSLEPTARGIGVEYTISFWEIPFGRTNFDIRFTADGYQTSSHFETRGVVSAFWNAIIDASSNGQLTQHGLSPSVYDSYYRRGEDKKERVKVTYGSNGIPSTYADPPYNTKRFPVTDEQKKGALDPLSAVSLVLSAIHSDGSKPCGTAAPVFDGRRRYNIDFTYLRDEPVKLSNGVYDGKAHLCQLHYDQIAGFKPKILKEGKAFPAIYGWFADIPSAAAPNGHYLVALKVWAATGWGTVEATLSQMKVRDSASKT